MEPDSNSGAGASSTGKKRTRVILSCGPCRASKLKCDRDQPCSQCAKKGRLDLCVYAPKSEKKRRPAVKGMAARLKRLEGMVRGMMDDQGNLLPQGQVAGASDAPPLRGQVVHGDRATTYVGATHCLAMLEDIEDIKSYFEDPEGSDEGTSPTDELDSPDLLLSSRGAPSSREELLAHLPEKHIVDRLITRYFSSRSPSQHIIHRPSFTKQYIRFWKDPSQASFHWIALLFMLLSLGVFFNNCSAPYEVEGDSPVSVHDRIKKYRSCAGWALVWGKYSQPTATTITAFILYVEAEFILNRATQMNCFIYSGICMRLLLKMGYHRDPSKLANMSPFESEMRRRQWHMAAQLDVLVSFHMGLPSILQGIEADTDVPRNLEDDDFDENSVELPPPRPDTGYTSMTYPIHKSRILKVFAKIAQQAHSLTPPSYSDVLKLDSLLQETWSNVPSFMHVRPLEECIGEDTRQIIQRFGIASLYHKSRCVLHRRYLAEAIPKPEHSYSRQQCLDAATELLNFQYTVWQGCQPGSILGPSGWFMTSLAVHDFMLAAMILYIIIQNDSYSDDGGGFGLENQEKEAPAKEELVRMIKRSHDISTQVFSKGTDLRKTADTLAIMLAKLGCPVDGEKTLSPYAASSGRNAPCSESSVGGPSTALVSSAAVIGKSSDHVSSGGFKDSSSRAEPPPPPFFHGQTIGTAAADTTSFTNKGNISGPMSSLDQFDLSWILSVENVDWQHLDASIAQNMSGGASAANANQTWVERLPLDDVDVMSGDRW